MTPYKKTISNYKYFNMLIIILYLLINNKYLKLINNQNK